MRVKVQVETEAEKRVKQLVLDDKDVSMWVKEGDNNMWRVNFIAWVSQYTYRKNLVDNFVEHD